MRRALPALLLSLALLTGACAQVAPTVQPPLADPTAIAAEAAFQQQAALERLRSQDRRVMAVGYRLRLAAMGLCKATAPMAGLVLHDAQEYGPDSRPYAVDYFHMGAGPSVLAIAPDSPASRAGLREDDQFLAVNGRPLTAPPAKGAASYDTLQAAWDTLNAELAKGPVRLDISRAGQTSSVALTPVTGCQSDIQQEPSDALQASANGRTVFITTAMTRYAVSDDQLAVVLSHELAHNLLGHQQRISASGPAGALFGNAGVAPASLMQLEREADYLGLYLMARAGFDVTAAETFWRQFGADYPASQYALASHPGSLERVANMRLAIGEIEAKRLAGQPLSPNPALPR